jgi:hypothetical protein
MTCQFCDGWDGNDCKVCKGTGEAHRWDQALEYYPSIKQLGLTIHDHNVTWYVNADYLEPKLKELLEKAWKYDELCK